MSDMTPREAADDIVGVKWLDMHEHADALRVLIDHARAAAPEGDDVRGLDGIRNVIDALKNDRGPFRDLSHDGLGDELFSAFRDLLNHRCAPSVAAPPRGDLAAWLDAEITSEWQRRERLGASSASERIRVLNEVRTRLEPAPSAVTPSHEDATPELWWHSYAGVIERGRNYPDLYFALGAGDGPITMLDALPDGAVRLVPTASGTVRDPERAT